MFPMKILVHYFCNLLIEKKQSTSYPLSTPIKLLAQIVYLRVLFLLKKRNFKAIGRFIQPLFHNWCFSFCPQNCKSNSCFLKKIQNQIITTIVQSPCYQTLEKCLESLCIRDCIPLLIRIMLSITYSFDSDNSILHLMP